MQNGWFFKVKFTKKENNTNPKLSKSELYLKQSETNSPKPRNPK